MNQHLTWGGCDVVELARQYGTPLYVVSEQEIRDRCKTLRQSIMDKYENTSVVFAGKAFLPLAICALVKQEGLGLDVVSAGELYTAKVADFPMDKIFHHGNAKTEEELLMALDYGVGHIVVDNEDELHLLEKLASRKNLKQAILLRLSPGINANTHKYIQTAQKDSKFGIPMDHLQKVVKHCLASPHVQLQGLHVHLGSQIRDTSSYTTAVEVMMGIVEDLQKTTGFQTKILNLGGGFGVPSGPSDTPVPIQPFIDTIMPHLQKICKEKNIPRPFIYLEPGRWIVAEAGITLYTVQSIKEIPDVRTYVAIDGGMTDNLRPSLYQAEYECTLASDIHKKADSVVTIAGRCCESGDILIRDAKIAMPEVGDIIAVYQTGAYNFSMANNYNRVRRAPVVFVKDGKSTEVVRRQTLEDLIHGETIPLHWK